MPELPEVEVVRAGLAERITGHTIDDVVVHHPRPVRRHLAGAADFATSLRGRRFATPRRRGKYLWLPFDDGDALLAHLGMSGQFRIDDDAARLAAGTGPVEHRHVRVTMVLRDGPTVRFCDQRMFGGLSLAPGGAELPAEIAHIALDPFEPGFDAAIVAARIHRRRTAIKRALLDQTVVSGIGNIYADEALWRARLHWARATDTLPRPRIHEVLDAAATVMTEALAVGGTSFDPLYVNVNGESGYFARGLSVYGREGLPCPRCGRAIVRDVCTNRSSFRCPGCQRSPRAAHHRG